MTIRKGDSPLRVKRLAKHARLTRPQVRAAYALYQGGLSLRGIAKLGWERWGYASERSCANCLHDLFKLEGFPLRDRIEATRAASTTHGLAPRKGRGDAYRELRRRRRDAREGSQPLCAATKKNYPRRGEPCQLKAMRGSVFCVAHDPGREAGWRTHLEHARTLAA